MRSYCFVSVGVLVIFTRLSGSRGTRMSGDIPNSRIEVLHNQIPIYNNGMK